MISASDVLHLPYTPDLTEGGIACAHRALPYSFPRARSAPYDRLRRAVASAAVGLAFRRDLAEQNIPFQVQSALPFTERHRYDVLLAGQRCRVRSFFVIQRQQVSQIRRD